MCLAVVCVRLLCKSAYHIRLLYVFVCCTYVVRPTSGIVQEEKLCPKKGRRCIGCGAIAYSKHGQLPQQVALMSLSCQPAVKHLLFIRVSRPWWREVSLMLQLKNRKVVLRSPLRPTSPMEQRLEHLPDCDPSSSEYQVAGRGTLDVLCDML